MHISVLKTNELSDTDWEEITEGFNESFSRDKKSEEFKRYYRSNVFGYTYHAVARNEEGRIVGHSSVIPIYYTVNGVKYKFGQGGTSYILKDYRKDIFLFAELYNALKAYCGKDDMKVITGVSNKNSFKYAIHIAKSTYVKDLSYYILPLSLSKVLKKPSLRLLDPFWRMAVLLLLTVNRLIAFFVNRTEKNWPVKVLEDEAFMEKRFNEKYTTIQKGEQDAVYRLYDEEGINTAYLMEFRQKGVRTVKALIRAVAHIVKKEKADAVLFIGTLEMKQFLLFKVPVKKVPQRFPLTIDYLVNDQEEVKKIVLSPDNWDFSLVNFDVR